MSEPRRLRRDVAAAALLLGELVVALALFSFDPADPPAATIWPPHGSPTNLLGVPGAALASALVGALGVGIYLLLAAWFVLVLFLFARRGVFRWMLRLLGWALLVPCAAVATERLGPDLMGGTTLGGGSVGAWLDWRLHSSFDPLSRTAIALGCLALSLLLALDFAAVWLVAGLRRLAPRLVGGVSRALTGWRLPKRTKRLTKLQTSASRERERPEEKPEPPFVAAPPGPLEKSAIPIHHVSTPTLPTEEAHPTSEDQYADYELPPLTLLQDSQPFAHQEQEQLLRDRAALLEKTFTDFNLNVRVVGIHTGPVITQYEVALETGLRVNKVTVLADDLALNLRVPNVRIVAPIPGKNTVGIEVPNEKRAVVRLKEVMLAAGFKPTGRSGFAAKAKLPLFLGKDTEGRPLTHDLAEMPHLLIAGRTGTGKSVCLNSLILSILMTRRPDEVKMLMIDPKRTEMGDYARLPHLMHPVVTDVKKAEAILAWAVDKMEERYDIFERARARNITVYNQLSPDEILRRAKPEDDEDRKRFSERMPYIVIFIDELADLIMQMKKEVENHIIRLAQKSRAAGIHLVVATQKPTVDVITGLIKSNLPARICFQVASRSDSMVVIDEKGADKLLGKGDMLFLQPGTSTLVRAQGCYASDEEIQAVVGRLECEEPVYAQELMQLHTAGRGAGGLMESLRERDPVYEQAIEVVVREGRGSTSLLQRALGIGYGRASRLIDFMAEDGIVGPYNGSSAREVLYTPERWEQIKHGGAVAGSA